MNAPTLARNMLYLSRRERRRRAAWRGGGSVAGVAGVHAAAWAALGGLGWGRMAGWLAWNLSV